MAATAFAAAHMSHRRFDVKRKTHSRRSRALPGMTAAIPGGIVRRDTTQQG
jgi:hypothetical protein